MPFKRIVKEKTFCLNLFSACLNLTSADDSDRESNENVIEGKDNKLWCKPQNLDILKILF